MRYFCENHQGYFDVVSSGKGLLELECRCIVEENNTWIWKISFSPAPEPQGLSQEK